jgi:hypothetical protein
MQSHRWIVIFIAAILLVANLGIGAAAPQAQSGYGEQPPPEDGIKVKGTQHNGNGPFGPPSRPDEIYSADSEEALDTYLYNDALFPDIRVAVDRVLGSSDNYRPLIDQGILAPTATLQILAWDVDVDYKGGDVYPEIDRVYLNNVYLGDLSGANDTWSLSTFQFNISILEFGNSSCYEGVLGELPSFLSQCSYSPYAMSNWITIEVDSANSEAVWGLELDWAAIRFEAARPVLFVHGLGGHYDEGGEPYPYPQPDSMASLGQPQEESASAPDCYYHPGSFGCQYWDRNDQVYFFSFRNKMASSGLLTQITENELVGDNSTLTNAGKLARIVDKMKTRYGVERINIVAHGKGGLDVRAYISDPVLNAGDNVAALITLASPHQGSYLADLARDLPSLALGKVGEGDSPALGSVTEVYTDTLFTPSYPGRWDVTYYTIGGDAGSEMDYGLDMPPEQIAAHPTISQQAAAPWNWSALANSGSLSGRNDGQVNAASSVLSQADGHLPGQTIDLGLFERNHHSLRAAMLEVGVEDNSVVDLLTSVLDVSPGYTSASPGTPDNLDGDSSAVSVYAGEINASQTISFPVGVDSSSTITFLLLWKSGPMKLDLVDANGVTHSKGNLGDGVSYLEDATVEGGDYNTLGELFAASKVIRYHVSAPVNGEWQAKVAAGPEQPPYPIDYLLLVVQESQVKLDLSCDAAWYPLDSPVTISARLTEAGAGLTGALVSAQVITPTGMLQVLDLYDDGSHGDLAAGDGEYANEFIAEEFGIYRLSAFASGTAGNGISFQRSDVTEVQAASGTAELASSGYSDQGIDLDGDGLFDWLEIRVPLNVSTLGEYLVSGVLEDELGSPLAWANGVVEGGPGSLAVSLRFRGDQIWAGQQSGPYWLRKVRLVDRRSVVLPVQVDYMQDVYQTAAYEIDSFQHSPLELLDIRDYGVDSNGNAKFDWLVFELDIKTDLAGKFFWSADLATQSGRRLGSTAGNGIFASGVNTISLQFPGQSIFLSHEHGPYQLINLLVWGEAGLLEDGRLLTSQAYNYGEFEPMPEQFFPQVMDFSGQQIENGDFEFGPGDGWREYSSNGLPLIMSVADGLPISPFSGEWLAWLGGADYETSILQQEVTIPQGESSLTFWHWIYSSDGCYYDYANIKFNGWILWSSTLCFSNGTNGWVQKTLDTSAFAGQEGTLEFRVTTDSSYASSLFLDDIQFTGPATEAVSVVAPARQALREPVLKKAQTTGKDWAR